MEDHFPHESQVEGLLVRKKQRFQTSTTTLPHQIEVEGFRLEPYATTFPHQIEVEGLVVRKKQRIEQVEGLAGVTEQTTDQAKTKRRGLSIKLKRNDGPKRY